MTEIVHCKSQSEKGVEKARDSCSAKWLDKVMQQSSARVVVLLGAPARKACTKYWKIKSEKTVHCDVPIAGIRRTVVILPHPNARKKRKLVYHTNDYERRCLLAALCQ